MRRARCPVGRPSRLHQLRCGLFRRRQSGDRAVVPAAVEPARRDASRARDHAAHGAQAAARDPAADLDLRCEDPHNGYGPNRFRRLAAKGEAITLFGEGEEKRDHVHIDDVAALVSATLHQRSTGTLNIATGKSTSFREVAEMVVAHFGRLGRDSRNAAAKSDHAPPFRHRRLSQGVSRLPLYFAAGRARPQCRERCVSDAAGNQSALEAAARQAQRQRARRGQDRRDRRDLPRIRRALFRRAARVRLWRLPLRRPLGSGRRGHGQALRPQAGRPRARCRLRQGISRQGFAEGVPGPRSVRPRHLRIRADALRAGGHWTAASRQRDRAAVSRQQLQGGDLAQHDPQSRAR